METVARDLRPTAPPAVASRPTASAPPDPRAMAILAGRRYDRGYSRFVAAMKVFLPLVAVVLVGLVVAWPHIKPDSRFRLGFSRIVVNDARSNDVVNPRLVGTDSENQPFSVTADLAKNVSFTADVDKFWREARPIELEMPKADITLRDGSWLVLTAETGVLAPARKVLDLAGKVNLFHDSGYEFRTAEAQIDLEQGAAVGDAPVEGQGPFGHLTAEGFQLLDKGRNILFTGKSKLIIYSNFDKAMP